MSQEQINRIRNLVREWRSVADGTLTYADRQGITTHAILAKYGQLARCARELEELLDEIAPETKL